MVGQPRCTLGVHVHSMDQVIRWYTVDDLDPCAQWYSGCSWQYLPPSGSEWWYPPLHPLGAHTEVDASSTSPLQGDGEIRDGSANGVPFWVTPLG